MAKKTANNIAYFTFIVDGETTRIYLTETSGLGVTVTDRKTGETRKMIRPAA